MICSTSEVAPFRLPACHLREKNADTSWEPTMRSKRGTHDFVICEQCGDNLEHLAYMCQSHEGLHGVLRRRTLRQHSWGGICCAPAIGTLDRNLAWPQGMKALIGIASWQITHCICGNSRGKNSSLLKLHSPSTAR